MIIALYKRNIVKYIIGLCFLFPIWIQGQSDIAVNIHKIAIDEEDKLNLLIKITENGKLINDPTIVNQLKITEKAGNDSLIIIEDIFIKDTTIVDENMDNIDTSYFTFLLDVSMEESYIFSAKSLIRDVITESSKIQDSEFYLRSSNDEKPLERERLNADNLETMLSELEKSDNNIDFFDPLVDEIRYLKGKKGPKALFVFGTGKNDTSSVHYERQIPYSAEDIVRIKEDLPSDLHIFVVSFGSEIENENFNSLIGENTHIEKEQLPEKYLEDLSSKSNQVSSNYKLIFIPKKYKYTGEERLYGVVYEEENMGSRAFRLGSINYPIYLARGATFLDWLLWFIVGLVVVFLVYGIGSLLVPFTRERSFIKKYVTPYKREEGRRRYDIYYNEPIRPGELVVTKCRQITPFSSWKENDWKCPNYPECLNQNCNGSGAPESNELSSMEGIYLKINWIWFGVMGGFLAWVFINLSRLVGIPLFKNVISRTLGGESFLTRISDNNPDLIIQTISNDLTVGVAFAAGLVMMLSWMEERRASNKYSLKNSILRIGLRTLIGIIASMFIFFLGFYLQYKVGVDAYFAGLASWMLFGLCIGLVISISSTVSVTNGIAGGVIAALIAYHIYWLLSGFGGLEFIQANLISMLLLGGIIGSILVSVITSLEDYELEVVSPAGYERTIPISKWLKSNLEVTIGKLPGSYIYVKWDDEAVRPEHAELFSEDGNVFVKPVDEVILNGTLISKPVSLKNGDIIKLGRSSVTQFRFVEK